MTVQISIVHHQGAWRMFHDGDWRGRYDLRVDAEEAALRLADRLRKTGADTVELFVQDGFGELKRRTPQNADHR